MIRGSHGFFVRASALLALTACSVMAQQKTPTIPLPPDAQTPVQNGTCRVAPRFLQPEFIKPDFGRDTKERPEFEDKKVYSPEFIQPRFVKAEFIKPQMLPRLYGGCSGYRYEPAKAGFTLEPAMAAGEKKPTAQVAASAYQYTPARKEDCCGSEVKVPAAAPAPAKAKIN